VPSASRSTLAIWLCAVLARQSFAQDLCLPPDDPSLTDAATENAAPDAAAPPDAPAPDELVFEAESFDFGADGRGEFAGQVGFRYRDCTFTADRTTVDDNNVEIGGGVTIECPDVTVYGEDAQVDTDAETVHFDGAGFDLPKRPAPRTLRSRATARCRCSMCCSRPAPSTTRIGSCTHATSAST
jgi:hypothetical protein